MTAATDRFAPITVDELHKLLTYNHFTGIFNWLVWRPNGVKAGDQAGTVVNGERGTGGGYRRIKFNKRAFQAARIAWFYMTGLWPENLVDHEDGNRDNNCWANLRPAQSRGNRANSVAHGKSGLKGAYKRVRGNCVTWESAIRENGKNRFLGSFNTPEEANAAYRIAAEAAFGEFARA